MNTRRHLFTSESVSEGHPDKIADQISDAILDAFLAEEPEAKVACETLVADNLVVITGEFKTLRKELFDEIRGRAESIARQVLRDIGYRDAETGIDPDACEVQVRFNHQSIQIHKGITLAGGDIGAGDQGLMFGYACDETPDLMPYPLWLAHRLVQKQAELRKSGALPWLRPDAKSQVTVAYEGHKMVGVETVIISTQIARDLDPAWVAQEVAREIVDPLVPAELRTPTFRLWVNPAGPFEIGGPNGDTGLTGRKIIVDTYGGSCPHGGGAFSGKDPTKVDRSAAYMARYIAKNLVAAGLARRCLVQLAYAIGVAEPVSLLVDTYGTGTVSDEKLEDRVRCSFRLTPRGIIESLDLRRPIYRKTAAYGHFGRAEPEFTWERTDQAEKLAAYKG
ncbi:MAG: methionine adenosyltransferase [Thiobacillus sp.]|uniref:methionine adenosyltransferase n=1 Tax=Thiobacillus sp. TaxID=924 RepID=UPI0028950B18|nr:methionine adenosyltransferase [Thiobacillus sp.]MDT3705981.1 methionine adenosyltransferase [Thiobacillus sp.]